MKNTEVDIIALRYIDVVSLGVALSLVHNMTLVRASRRERREHRERRFVNYPASVSVCERWLTLE